MGKTHWSGTLTVINNTDYTINWIQYHKAGMTKHHIHTIDPNGGTQTNTMTKNWDSVKNKLEFYTSNEKDVYMTSEVEYGPTYGVYCDRGNLSTQNIKLYGDSTQVGIPLGSTVSGTQEKTWWQTANWSSEMQGVVFVGCPNDCSYTTTITFSMQDTQDTDMMGSGVPPVSEYDDRL